MQKSASSTSTLDLFGPADGLAGLCEAFDRWAQHERHEGRVRRSDSMHTYRELWQALLNWSVREVPDLAIETLSSRDLERFLASRNGAAGAASEASPRYVWRLLDLIDRVLEHDAQHRGVAEPNDAARVLLASRPDWRYANDSSKQPLPQCLVAAEAKTLVNYLSSARPRVGRGVDEHRWAELRNRASVAVQLGAGLTPMEIRGLRLADVVTRGGPRSAQPWKLVVKPQPLVPGEEGGTSVERETPVAAWAGQVLDHWLSIRNRFVRAGDFVFPATRTGKPWSKNSQYAAVREVLDASGIDKSLVPGGSFRLRHTFALRQLRRGRTPDEVARWMGLEPEAMRRYQRVLYAPVQID